MEGIESIGSCVFCSGSVLALYFVLYSKLQKRIVETLAAWDYTSRSPGRALKAAVLVKELWDGSKQRDEVGDGGINIGGSGIDGCKGSFTHRTRARPQLTLRKKQTHRRKEWNVCARGRRHGVRVQGAGAFRAEDREPDSV